MRAFCVREQLSEASFYGWRRTIGERDGESAPSFVPVVVSDGLIKHGPTGDALIVIELVGGHVLKL